MTRPTAGMRAVIDASETFAGNRLLSDIGPSEVARRARMLARAHGVTAHMAQVEQYALACLDMGSTPAAAIHAARTMALELSEHARAAIAKAGGAVS